MSSSPSGTNSRSSRARQYISRIMCLNFEPFPTPRESALFTAISGLVQSSPICPNLQKILLGSGISNIGVVYSIAPLISPGMRSIAFVNTISDVSQGVAISTLLNLLKCYGVQLHKISYRGPVSPLIVQHISEFSTLRSIVIQPSKADVNGGVQSLSGMGDLTKLDIHLGIFRENTPIGDLLARMPSLVTLNISGSWSNINVIMNRSYTAVQSLSLFLDSPTPTWGQTQLVQRMELDVFSRISTAFSKLRTLCLTLREGQPAVVVSVTEILALRERPSEVLELRHLPVSLSTTGIVDIIAAWPLLRRLCIIPSAAHRFACEANIVLLYMSNHASKLQDVDLPLDFSAFATNPLPSPLVCRCPLQKLNLFQACNLPNTFREKLAFCRNLI